MRERIYLFSPPTGLDAHSQSALDLPFPVTPLLPDPLLTGCFERPKSPSAHQRPRTRHLAVQTVIGGIGISTDCPSPTPRGLGLGPTNPTRINLPSEPSAIRWACLLTRLTLLMPAFALVTAPPPLTRRLHRRSRRSPTTRPKGRIRSFGSRLEPRYIVGAASLDQ